MQAVRLVFTLLIALALAAPAFPSHACDAEASISADQSVQVASASTPADDCGDCGAACAHGCCHAPHVAVAPDLPVVRTASVEPTSAVWSDMSRLPARRPNGPDRPPRL